MVPAPEKPPTTVTPNHSGGKGRRGTQRERDLEKQHVADHPARVYRLNFGRIKRKQFKHQLFHVLIDFVRVGEKLFGMVLTAEVFVETE